MEFNFKNIHTFPNQFFFIMSSLQAVIVWVRSFWSWTVPDDRSKASPGPKMECCFDFRSLETTNIHKVSEFVVFLQIG